MNLSGVRTGPLVAGERVTLTDGKGRRKSILLLIRRAGEPRFVALPIDAG